jgi:hypothetical protein
MNMPMANVSFVETIKPSIAYGGYVARERIIHFDLKVNSHMGC